MKYLIKKAEAVTSAKGTTYKRATLEAEGVTIDVSVWSDYSQYDKVENGNEVEGVIVENGKYKNLKDGNLGAKPPSFAQKSRMTNAMAKNAEYIGKAQSNREEGVKTASTARMATDIVVVLVEKGELVTPQDIEISWKNWRKWFIKNWDVDVTDNPPF